MSSLIVDVSVVAKWYLPAEVGSESAQLLRKDFINNQIDLHAPSLIYFELTNVLNRSVKAGRLNFQKGRTALESFYRLDIKALDSLELFLESFKITDDFNVSAYDASYVALAKLQNLPLYTADEKLVRAVAKKIPLVKRLSDYPGF